MILAVIPARGGSKGLKDKNISILGDKPLIYHTLTAALECKFIDKIVVTTDSDRIATLCSPYAEIVRRDIDLADDQVPLAPVIIDALGKSEKLNMTHYDTIITLQPTSPFRGPHHISEAWGQFMGKRADSLLSVREEFHSIWTKNKDTVVPVSNPAFNRQWVSPFYTGNGAIFITKREILLKHKNRVCGKTELFVMDEVSSIDIHTKEDLELAEWHLERAKA